jgi:antitoxin StbD|tara:strand:- start:537 stop:833 length:297 start_codon:yes stop_codon:yes gene_type:complete
MRARKGAFLWLQEVSMHQVLANFSVSISELKKNPSALLSQASGAPIAVLNHNKPAAYLVPVETYEAMMEMLEDYELAKLVEERRADKDKAVTVSLDDL